MCGRADYANRRDGLPGRQVWYNFSDRQVRSERHFRACLHYIIWNPVKHGYVETMSDWPWSCVHELTAEHGAAWVEELVREHPLRDFGADWDLLNGSAPVRSGPIIGPPASPGSMKIEGPTTNSGPSGETA